MAIDPADYTPGDELANRDQNNRAGMMGTSETLDTIENIRVEDGRLIVLNRVWDTTTSTWVRQEQTATDTEALEIIMKGDYWHDSRIEYDSDGLFQYVGQNATMNATTSGTDWIIAKIDYDADYNINRVRVQTTSWDSRAIGW